MIDPARHELLKLIEELSTVCPEYRLGQMILNLAFLAREDGDRLIWDIEDSELIEAARRHLADWSTSRGQNAEASRSQLEPGESPRMVGNPETTRT